VIYPASATWIDYEGEAAIVLGKRGKDITADRFGVHIWGVALFADWSARDVREANAPHKFVKSKNFDTCASLGPCIVVGEPDPGDILVETLVNGDTRQHFSTRGMAFPLRSSASTCRAT
jgi:2-keto-4-pentenoate hydratase/2-oxohepta-3-ene-1,7-dioic acid hydratase in catechol pathway